MYGELLSCYSSRSQNLGALRQEGSLSRLWNQLPAVIQDSIKLVSSLNERLKNMNARTDFYGPIYLWIDQLCILQDDPKDKETQIIQMHHIYSQAIVSIAATSDADASERPPRIHANEQPPPQAIENIKWCRLVVPLPDLTQMLQDQPMARASLDLPRILVVILLTHIYRQASLLQMCSRSHA